MESPYLYNKRRLFRFWCFPVKIVPISMHLPTNAWTMSAGDFLNQASRAGCFPTIFPILAIGTQIEWFVFLL
jgi:hypothetical protein